jgi:hypothetical protein
MPNVESVILLSQAWPKYTCRRRGPNLNPNLAHDPKGHEGSVFLNLDCADQRYFDKRKSMIGWNSIPQDLDIIDDA